MAVLRDRHRFIVAYDIADPKRLRRVHKTAKEFGWAMQLSVFIADLDGMELVELQLRMAEIIDHGRDSVVFINVGRPAERGKTAFEFLGVPLNLPSSGPLII